MSQHRDPMQPPHGGARRRGGGSGPARSPSPGRMSSASAAMSTASRYEANQSMRERAAQMWLEQLRQNHDRRRNVAQRSVEISEYQRNSTLQKINDKDSQLQASRRSTAEFRGRRTDAFVERQQYLAAAKQHAEAVQESWQQQVEQHSAAKMMRGDQLHADAMARRQLHAYEKNTQRHSTAQQNQQMLDQYRAEHNHRVISADTQASQRVAEQRRADDEERRRRRMEAEVNRRDTLSRAGQINERRRAEVEGKIGVDNDRSARVLQSRQQYLHDRALMKRDQEAHVADQVRRAQAARDAKEREWEQHYEETVAIGRETAEHNKLFKLNNRIMHQLMVESQSQPRFSQQGSTRRSLQSPQRGDWR